MRNIYLRKIPTNVDYNLPIISFSKQPEDVTIGSGTTANFVGVATVQYRNATSSGSGSFTYQWYDFQTSAPVVAGSGVTIAGAATTEFSITGLVNPTNDGNKYFLRATFVPTYTGQGGTPNADPTYVDSTAAVVTINPFMTFVQQPTTST
mgnify:CR=1 FL=1